MENSLHTIHQKHVLIVNRQFLIKNELGTHKY